MRRLHLLPVLMVLCACRAEPLPEIVRDLPAADGEAAKVFDGRLKGSFPPGTSEERLVEDLRSDGFDVPAQGEESRSAALIHERPTNRRFFLVDWQAERGVVTSIGGDVHTH
jgi:hypothetical protein